jgi:hypothetical protein
VFHDTQESLRQSMEADLGSLRGAGYQADVVTVTVSFVWASVARGGRQTKIE